jgi:hypothetical protein
MWSEANLNSGLSSIHLQVCGDERKKETHMLARLAGSNVAWWAHAREWSTMVVVID